MKSSETEIKISASNRVRGAPITKAGFNFVWYSTLIENLRKPFELLDNDRPILATLNNVKYNAFIL